MNNVEVELTFDDVLSYANELEASLTTMAEANKSLRRTVAAYRAATTRRRGNEVGYKTTLAEAVEQNEILATEVVNLKRSIAAYKASATRRNAR